MDEALVRLAQAPPHPELGSIGDAVLAGVDARIRQGGVSNASLGLAMCGALLVGIAGAALPVQQASAESSNPLGAPSALAPSTLLASTR